MNERKLGRGKTLNQALLGRQPEAGSFYDFSCISFCFHRVFYCTFNK